MGIESRLYRLSMNQLKVLKLLAESRRGVVDSARVGKKIGLRGKALGGVFSSLARQRVGKERLILPWGRSREGVGLRWRLNTKLISQRRLAKIVDQLLAY